MSISVSNNPALLISPEAQRNFLDWAQMFAHDYLLHSVQPKDHSSLASPRTSSLQAEAASEHVIPHLN